MDTTSGFGISGKVERGGKNKYFHVPFDWFDTGRIHRNSVLTLVLKTACNKSKSLKNNEAKWVDFISYDKGATTAINTPLIYGWNLETKGRIFIWKKCDKNKCIVEFTMKVFQEATDKSNFWDIAGKGFHVPSPTGLPIIKIHDQLIRELYPNGKALNLFSTEKFTIRSKFSCDVKCNIMNYEIMANTIRNNPTSNEFIKYKEKYQ